MLRGFRAPSQCSCRYQAQTPGTAPTITATLMAPLATFTKPRSVTTKAMAMTPSTITVATTSVGPWSRTTRVCAPWLCRRPRSRKSTRSWVRMCASTEARSGSSARVLVTQSFSARAPSPTTMREPRKMPTRKLRWRRRSPATAAETNTGSSSRTTLVPTATGRSLKAQAGRPPAPSAACSTSAVLRGRRRRRPERCGSAESSETGEKPPIGVSHGSSKSTSWTMAYSRVLPSTKTSASFSKPHVSETFKVIVPVAGSTSSGPTVSVCTSRPS
mmetsp:Transcript_119895/g.373384  ORF Transcript_119895/g.373384 Transcript_119895/m.373384 type:complete len:273 (-) Transcript_119895:616-1434(-)